MSIANVLNNYLDGFIFPLPKKNLDQYQAVAEQVADIWKEYGAISYSEFIGDELFLEGTRSFTDALDLDDSEVVIFGYVLFPDKRTRDEANEKVPQDPRMSKIVAPLMNPDHPIFDARRMVYGGFKSFVGK